MFNVMWSPEGANAKVCEESVIFGWTNYVHECGSKNMCYCA